MKIGYFTFRMNKFSKWLVYIYLLTHSLAVFAAVENRLSPEAAKDLVKKAVVYALTNMSPDMDYSVYVSKDFINPIDGKTFNYEQWVTHQKNIKAMVKSMVPHFHTMVAEGNNVAAVFDVHIVKKDGTELIVKDFAFFKIKNNKIVYVEELTRLIKGPPEDQAIGSTE